MTNEKYNQLVTEVFGCDYLKLIQPVIEERKVSERNAKLCCITHVLDIYKFIGREITSNTFDDIYDLELSDLQALEIAAEDLSYSFAKGKGIVK